MRKYLDKKIRLTYMGKDIDDAILSIEQNIWCLFSNNCQINDLYKEYIKNRRGYEYVWCFGTVEFTSEEEIFKHFSNVKLLRKMNHESEE